MKTLFISSGNSKSCISPIIKNQGESLKASGVELEYYTIKGKGLTGHLKNIKPLRKYLKQNNFDIIHAHYSLSAFVASLAGAKPLVVSLMGSDVKSESYYKQIIKLFNRFNWKAVIVKSADMKASLGVQDVYIIPNGVDFDKFKPLEQIKCKQDLGWDISKKQILFAANPNRYEKNYILAEKAVKRIGYGKSIELKALLDVPNNKMPLYHNAADVILLTSLWEGSPNVIKEAMACNIPIVSTDVGDVPWLFGSEPGNYITTFNPKDVAKKIKLALEFEKEQGKTNGRERLVLLGLEDATIAKKIINLYNQIIRLK